MSKAKALFTTRQRLVPQFGVIEGGLLGGWSFAFQRLVLVKGKVFLDLRCTAPNWTFPKLVRVGMADYLELRNPGMTAPTQEMQQLIDAAVERARTGQQK